MVQFFLLSSSGFLMGWDSSWIFLVCFLSNRITYVLLIFGNGLIIRWIKRHLKAHIVWRPYIVAVRPEAGKLLRSFLWRSGQRLVVVFWADE
jgi:hypothetical protein